MAKERLSGFMGQYLVVHVLFIQIAQRAFDACSRTCHFDHERSHSERLQPVNPAQKDVGVYVELPDDVGNDRLTRRLPFKAQAEELPLRRSRLEELIGNGMRCSL